MRAWTERWENQSLKPWDHFLQPPQKEVLKIHSKLRKAESSVLIQLRTGRIGLAHFLNKARVPEFDTGQCRCGHGAETPRHLLLYCPEEEDRREQLGPRAVRSFVRLLNTQDGAAVAAKWVIQSGRLRQFEVASSLLYE